MEAVKKDSHRMISPTRVALAEYDRQDWVATAEVGTTKEEVLDPAYWAHLAAKMKPYDKIEVRVDDGEWMMELVVLACDRTWAKVHMLHFYQLAKVETKNMSTKHDPVWKGPHLKWCVIRNSDQTIVQEKLDSREAANVWIKEHEKVT